MNKASWSALFEPFQFFEAYRNYLQVDIIAEDDEDLRLWKGWVESRLRQLTLKVMCSFVISVASYKFSRTSYFAACYVVPKVMVENMLAICC